MNSSDWFLVLSVWLSLAAWQMVFGSLIVLKTSRKLADGGWAWGRLTGWLVISLIVWFLGHLNIPINTLNGIRGVALALLLVGGRLAIKNRKQIRGMLWEKKWLFLAEEVLFLGGLIWLTWVRGHNPAVLDLEKFMDGGFMQGYLRSPTLPAMDMWLSGEKINYYTFGHFMGAVMIQVWGIDLAYSYNLLLGLIMGLTLTLTFSAVVNLIGEGTKKSIIGGMIAAVLMGWGGNTHAIWYWLKNGSWKEYWYADATRFIYHTIHEFPAYSFVVSDLHGHLWDLPVVLMFLGVLIGWHKSMGPHPRGAHSVTSREWSLSSPKVGPFRLPNQEYIYLAVGMGVLFGVMAMTNTWDVLIYGMLMGMASLLMAGRMTIQKILESWIVMGVTALIVALPFALNFIDIGQGVRLVTMRSPLWQLAVLWSGQMLITLIAVLINFRQKNKNLLIWAMAASAVALLIIPELIFVKDIYPEHPRANTMFKLTYQAFVMMTVLIGWVVAQIHPRGAHSVTSGVLKKLVNTFLLVIVVGIIGGLMTFPYFAYRDYYGSLKTYQGLDGLAWLAKESPGDFAAILWMKKNIQGRPVILEAVGESYTKHGRFSAFTGLPTVLGWRVHEWLWRGGFEIPGKRTQEVIQIYEQPSSEEAVALIKRYQVKYVVVGKLEREDYHLDIEGLEQLGEVVFESGNTKIIEVDSR